MTISTDLYSLTVKQYKKRAKIIMQMISPMVTTKSIPQTLTILQDQLPGVLQTKCYNEDKLPFAVEVQKTELGHLFEHIILQYMLELKMSLGDTQFVLKGTTSWDWDTEPFGTFNIYLNVGKNDRVVLSESLNHATKLFDTILESVYLPATYEVNREQSLPIY